MSYQVQLDGVRINALREERQEYAGIGPLADVLVQQYISAVKLKAERKAVELGLGIVARWMLKGNVAPNQPFHLRRRKMPSADGSDLALKREAYASSCEDQSHSASCAVDGDPGTRWAADWRKIRDKMSLEWEQWLHVDLAQMCSVYQVADVAEESLRGFKLIKRLTC